MAAVKCLHIYLVLLFGLSLVICDEDHRIGGTVMGKNGKLRQRTIEEEEEFFLKLIFEKYGQGGKISFEGFEHLLQSLGLAKIFIDDHDIHDHIQNGQFKDFHGSHLHFSLNKTENLTQLLDTHEHDHEEHHDHHDEGHHDGDELETETTLSPIKRRESSPSEKRENESSLNPSDKFYEDDDIDELSGSSISGTNSSQNNSAGNSNNNNDNVNSVGDKDRSHKKTAQGAAETQ